MHELVSGTNVDDVGARVRLIRMRHQTDRQGMQRKQSDGWMVRLRTETSRPLPVPRRHSLAHRNATIPFVGAGNGQQAPRSSGAGQAPQECAVREALSDRWLRFLTGDQLHFLSPQRASDTGLVVAADTRPLAHVKAQARDGKRWVGKEEKRARRAGTSRTWICRRRCPSGALLGFRARLPRGAR